MMKKYLIMCSLFLTSFCSAAQEQNIDIALSNYMNSISPNYEVAYYDLNSDGLQDAFVYINDRDWCGSGGCTSVIFKGTKLGFLFVSKTMIVKKPIIVTSSKSFGWFNLIVNTGGIGSVILKSDGNKYPLNPSVQPTADINIESNKYILFEN